MNQDALKHTKGRRITPTPQLLSGFIFSYLHHAEQLSCTDQRQAQNRHIEHGSAAADRKQRHKDEHDAA